MTAPVDVGLTFLGEIATRFAQRHPEVRLDVSLSDRTVELIAEGFDVAIRAGPMRDSSLVVRKLLGTETQLFATPSYLARRGTPRTPRELESQDCVLFRPQEGHKRWTLTGPRESTSVDVSGRVGGDGFLFVRAAVLAGAGIGPLPSFLAQRDVADGQLVQVLTGWSLGGSALHLVYPSSRHVPRRVLAFRDFLLESFRTTTGR